MLTSRMFSPDENGAGEPKPDLMGYKSVEDLVNAKRASDAELKRIAEKVNSLEQTFNQYQRPQVPTRFNSPDEELSTYGVPVNALDAYVNQRLEKAFAPIAQGMQARQSVVARYPDYAKFESEVAKYVSENPELQSRYQRMFSADPESAMEYAMLKFTDSRRDSAPEKVSKKESARDAAIPSSRSGDSRGITSSDNDDVARAKKHYQETGDPQYYGKARLRQIISDDFYNR
jgi:hypothetical protein